MIITNNNQCYTCDNCDFCKYYERFNRGDFTDVNKMLDFPGDIEVCVKVCPYYH